MYNKDPDNKKKRMVFIPRILKIEPGDTVKFRSISKKEFKCLNNDQ